MNECLETEVLIIGSGIAGGAAALQLADSGIPVTVITRAGQPQESNTYYAQGGIIYKGAGDSPDLLAEDIMRAGAGHCRPGSVSILAEDGPGLVEDILLRRIGVPFDRNEAGLSLAREGGHSLPRIIHAADATGKAISAALIEALQRHPKVTLLSGYTAVDLIMPDPYNRNRPAGYEPPACRGAFLLDQANRRVVQCLAKHTIVATGGLGQIFERTTNPPGARGDGIAMAYRAGARMINLEFVQFHPTAFYHPQAAPFLISEAVRGDGARLVDANGAPFMQNYDPEWRDLAPRDVVARSIHQEMSARNTPNVYLDLRSFIPTRRIREHFPNIYDYCLSFGVDITRDLVPVTPAAHYSCGGVSVDGWGRTTIERLYAVGEVACTGVHGANRLASTSLLEGLVWGDRAAQDIRRRLGEQGELRSEAVQAYAIPAPVAPDPEQISRYWDEVRSLMWSYVGLRRTTAGLEYALAALHHLEAEVESFYRGRYPTDGMVGLRNGVQTARLVALAALQNKESLGCHYRAEDEAMNEEMSGALYDLTEMLALDVA